MNFACLKCLYFYKKELVWQCFPLGLHLACISDTNYLFIMCEICWSCYDSLLIICDDMLIVAMNNSWSCITTVNHICWSCMIYVDHPIIRLLIKCDICWSCYDAAVDHGWNLLIMLWKPIDHMWWYVDRSYEEAVDHTWCIT